MKPKEKFVNVAIKIVISIIAIILVLLALGATIKTGFFNSTYNIYNETIEYYNDNIFLNIILTIILLYGITQLTKKVKTRTLLIIMLILFIILSISWIIISKTPLKADQKVVEEIAKQFINGDYSSFEENGYMFNHPMQLSIVFFIELIYRITNIIQPILLKMLNVVFMTITLIYIYKITKILFNNERIQKISIILLLGCTSLILFTTYVYGNIVGLMFGTIAIYETINYLENRKIKSLIIMGISITLSVILKSNYQIFLIAIVILLILDCLKKFDYKSITTIVSIVILIILSNSLITQIAKNRIGKEVPEGIPMITYIYMGIAKQEDRASGWYNAEVNVEKTFLENEFDIEKTKQESKQEIQKRVQEFLKNPIEGLKFYADKIASTWLEPAFQTIWINEPAERYEDVKDDISSNKFLISLYDGKLNKILIRYLDSYQIIIFAFSAIYIITNFKKINTKQSLILVIFLGGFLFHILWEAKCIYVLTYFVLLIPYASCGINKIYTILEDKIKHKNNS